MPRRRRLAPLSAVVLASAACASSAHALELEPFPGSPLTIATPSDVAVRDLDGDGRPDIAVAGEATDRVEIFERDAAGAFAPAHSAVFPVGSAPRRIAFGTLHGTLPDLVAAGPVNLATVLNFGGSFGSSVNHTLPTVNDAIALELVDVQGDPRPEAIVLDRATAAVRVYDRNPSSAEWELVDQFPTDADPRDMAVGDFDGDGRPDLVVATGSTVLTVAFGAASGFEPPITVPGVGSGSWTVAAADFDGDGRDDIATPRRGSATVTVLLGAADRGFTSAAGAVVGNGPEGVAVGDLNGDGRVDLASMPTYRGELVLTLGDGDGGFTVAHQGRRSLLGGPDVTFADLDGDGLDDVILRYHGDNRIELLRNVTRRAAATTAPTVSGTPAVGATLTCDPGTWSGSEPLATTVAWLRDEAPIAEETGTTYVIAEEDRGTTVTCAVTGANELPAVTVAALGVAVPAPPTEEPPTEEPPVKGPPAERPPVEQPPAQTVPNAPAIDVAPPAIGRGRDVTLAFSGGGAFECRLDDGPWSACASPHLFSGLRAGDHAAAVRAVGADGTRGPASTVSFQVNPYPPGVRVRGAKLRATHGAVPIRLTCSAREGEGRGACRGTVALRTTGARPRVLARGSFRAGAGRTTTARLRLTAAGRRALRGAKAPLRLRAVVRARDLAGNAGVVSRRVTLR